MSTKDLGPVRDGWMPGCHLFAHESECPDCGETFTWTEVNHPCAPIGFPIGKHDGCRDKGRMGRELEKLLDVFNKEVREAERGMPTVAQRLAEFSKKGKR